MAVTTLDPHTALLVIDLQQALLAGNPSQAIHDVVERAATLADAFRAQALPVVLVEVRGTPPGRSDVNPQGGSRTEGWTDLLPQLNRQPQDQHVIKRAWGAFTGTNLEATMKLQGVTQVVICGVATSLGVESTARQGADAGFHVTLATDAMLDRTPEAHAFTVQHVFPLLGETGSVEDIIALLPVGKVETQ